MIYINGRFLLQEQTGVNRFAYEICRALVEMGVDLVLLCPCGKIKACYDTSFFIIRYCKGGNSHIWEQLFLPLYFWKIKGGKILINFTGLGPIAVRHKIMTIHDLAFMVNPKWYSPLYAFLYKILTPMSAATSMKILTVSEFSKNEIIRLLSVKQEKIAVVYNAVSPFFNQEDDITVNDVAEEKYVLAVSSIDPRKNFTTLLKAFALLDIPDVKLYVVGGQSHIYSASVGALRKEIPNGKVEWLGRVTDVQLKTYYKKAQCFVYPSVYEGFGIPPLEAMACGIPTVVSDIPPLREVCGDASLYVNPSNEKDIAEKLTLLLSDIELQKQLCCAGHVRCELFSWGRSARIVYDLVCELQKI